MTEKDQNNQTHFSRHNQMERVWLIVLISICMTIVIFGGIGYVSSLREGLMDQSVQNVLAVTQQQRQAFDSFISGDRERLHSFSEFFARNDFDGPEEIQRQLTMFDQVDAIYSVICLDEGWFCSNAASTIRLLSDEDLEFYSSLSGSGIRDSYTGLFSGQPKFGYYETFTFANGDRGLIQKSYDRAKVSDTFSLSFYNGQGFAYIVERDGSVLLHSTGVLGDQLHENIFDLLTGTHGLQKDIDVLRQALQDKATGSEIFTGEQGDFVYTYVPSQAIEDWFLVSIIPLGAITTEADRILMDSQLAFILLLVILAVCAVFLLLFWRTHKEIKDKNDEIDYQAQLIDIFSTYLSRNADNVYMMLDPASRQLEYVSPNAEQMLGVGEDELLDSLNSPRHVCACEEMENFQAVYQLQPGDQVENISAAWTDPATGEEKLLLESVYCAQVQGHSKLVLYISDRTQERRTQITLSEALQMAQAANNAKSAFLSSVSHDIRTPMNAIIGFLELMRNEADNPDVVREYAQRIDAASQHLLGLINDVLDMNKIESGSATLNLVDLNMADMIDEINTIIRPQAKAKEQTFDIFVTSITYEHLQGDKLRINQILINLLSNAVKYTPEGGHIEFKVEELPQVVSNYSRIRFTVQDNGLGMSKEYQKVIFDPFTREQTDATREVQGTGLGMAITKSLVDLMGGTISVRSTLGKGSTFTVELELYIQEKEHDLQFWTDHHLSKMIVADDEEEVCLGVVKAMAKTGVHTDYAVDGRTAIDMMRTARENGEPYDLILLDWKMPGLDGLETARLIRKNYPVKIPILLFTAYDWGEIEQEAREIGIHHFLPKPFFMSAFMDAIRRITDGLRHTDENGPDAALIQGRHILVVDDIEVNRIILVKILTTLGASCDTAANGQEAVETFQQSEAGRYDLIMMDVQMPVMDGYQATRTIRACGHPEAKTLPIIAMTANAFVDDVRDAIDSGMDAHIAKPIQMDMLKSTLQTVLEDADRKKAKAARGAEASAS